jgi:hypothetical protein
VCRELHGHGKPQTSLFQQVHQQQATAHTGSRDCTHVSCKSSQLGSSLSCISFLCCRLSPPLPPSTWQPRALTLCLAAAL